MENQTHNFGAPERYVSFPPTIGYDGLSALLGRSVGSLQADKCRKPHTLPPECTPDGTKSPIWLTQTVLDWLKEKEKKPAEIHPPTLKSSHSRSPGRPRKGAAK